MKFAVFVLLALSVAFLRPSACGAQQTAQPPVQQAVPPVTASPPSPAIAVPTAPAHHSRSLQKAAPYGVAPAPAAESRPNSGNPDVVIGGLPGAQPATAVEKQP